jgi:aryl-alcohol dehydrogenase-like predicted oxidoreductase
MFKETTKMAKMNAKPLIAGISKPVSQLALGTAFYSVNSKEEWFDILDHYVGFGGTIVDTARGYSTSEEVIGLWLETRATRNQIIVQTKCGLTGESYLPAANFPEVVREDLTTSLQALRTDYIDVLLLHRDNQEMTVAEILGPLNNELANGRIHAFGASNWEYRRLTEANEYADKHGMKSFAVVSNNISLAVPTAAFYKGLVSTDKTGERWHEETGIPLIPWSSQARGFFTGRYTTQMVDDLASASSELDGFTSKMLKVYGTDENFKRLARAKELGEKKGGYTAVEVALAYLLHKPFPIVPVVGPRNREELASCVKALSLTLTEAEIKWLNLET